jgi:hypothetical protein
MCQISCIISVEARHTRGPVCAKLQDNVGAVPMYEVVGSIEGDFCSEHWVDDGL